MIAATLEAMFGATLLMLMILAVRGPVAHWFGAGWAYALWLLPALRLVLPPMPSLAPIPVPSVTVILPAAEGVAAPVAASGGALPWLEIALALWAGGAVIFLLWQQSAYSAFLLHLGPQGRPADPPAFGGVRVVESEAVEGPVALGIFSRRIVVPTDFATRYSAAERRLALEHELVHHRRFDLWWNFAAVAVLALNWFNPIAHFAFRAFRADQELSCDAAVARRAPSERHDYACALVKSACQPGLIATCPLGSQNHAHILKRRLKMMNQHRGGWGRSFGGATAVAAVGAAGLALSSPGIAQEQPRPRVIVQAAAAQGSIIDEADLRTLREKCGDANVRRGGAIVCEDGNADPEVRAIVAKTVKKAEARVAAARLSPERMAEIEASVAAARSSVEHIDHDKIRAQVEAAMKHARPHLIRIERGEHMAHAREALERARAQLAEIDIDTTRMAAMRSAMAAARAHMASPAFTAERQAEIDAAMAEARREIEAIDFEAVMEEAEAELARELEQLPEER